jgi:hypothetical protein
MSRTLKARLNQGMVDDCQVVACHVCSHGSGLGSWRVSAWEGYYFKNIFLAVKVMQLSDLICLWLLSCFGNLIITVRKFSSIGFEMFTDL